MSTQTTRRDFLATTAAAGGYGLLAGSPLAMAARSANEQISYAAIGVGIRGSGLLLGGAYFASCAAICDVDSDQLSAAAKKLSDKYREKSLAGPRPMLCEDYRRVLDRRDIDAVIIGTPDHWHTKIAIEALHAGKAVYCEKPLTLTIAEGQQIEDALAATGGVLAVGAQQRSMALFQSAAAIVRDGRLGGIKRVTCGLGGAPKSKVLPIVAPPRVELEPLAWPGAVCPLP